MASENFTVFGQGTPKQTEHLKYTAGRDFSLSEYLHVSSGEAGHRIEDWALCFLHPLKLTAVENC